MGYVLLVLVVVIDYLVVGVVVLLSARIGVALGLTAHVGIALGRRLLVQLLAHLIEQLGQLLGSGLDGVGVLALQSLLQLIRPACTGAFSLSGTLSPTSLRVFSA